MSKPEPYSDEWYAQSMPAEDIKLGDKLSINVVNNGWVVTDTDKGFIKLDITQWINTDNIGKTIRLNRDDT